MVRAWYMDDSYADKREVHMTNPPQFVDLETLSKFGVNYWKVLLTSFSLYLSLCLIVSNVVQFYKCTSLHHPMVEQH